MRGHPGRRAARSAMRADPGPMSPGLGNQGEAGVHGSRLSRLEALGRDDAARERSVAPRWYVFFFFALLLFSTAAQALVFPTLSGRVVDEPPILDQATRTALTQKLADLEAKTTDQVVVAIVKSLQGTSVEDYGNRLFREWKLGHAGKNNGVLLLVVPSEKRVRIEVGYGLEGTLPDAVSKLIIENGITPRFRANDYAGGITRGVDDIIQVLTGDAEEWKRRAAAQRPEVKSAPIDFGTIFLVCFVIFMVIQVIRSYNQPPLQAGRRGRRRASRDSSDSWWVPSSGSWSSGSSDSSWGSGGGDSGGF